MQECKSQTYQQILVFIKSTNWFSSDPLDLSSLPTRTCFALNTLISQFKLVVDNALWRNEVKVKVFSAAIFVSLWSFQDPAVFSLSCQNSRCDCEGQLRWAMCCRVFWNGFYRLYARTTQFSSLRSCKGKQDVL